MTIYSVDVINMQKNHSPTFEFRMNSLEKSSPNFRRKKIIIEDIILTLSGGWRKVFFFLNKKCIRRIRIHYSIPNKIQHIFFKKIISYIIGKYKEAKLCCAMEKGRNVILGLN